MNTVYTVDEGVKIKNAKGPSDRECECGSWLDHWENFANKSAKLCSVSGCNDTATVGAHVTRPIAKNEDYKTHPYIVPICKSHNGQDGGEFYTKDNTTFVWANVANTCGS